MSVVVSVTVWLPAALNLKLASCAVVCAGVAPVAVHVLFMTPTDVVADNVTTSPLFTCVGP